MPSCAWPDLWRKVCPLLLPPWCLNWAAWLKGTIFVSSPIGMCLSHHQSLTSEHDQVDCRWPCPCLKSHASKLAPESKHKTRTAWQIKCRNLVPHAPAQSVCQQVDTTQLRKETAGSNVCYLIMHPRHRQSGYSQPSIRIKPREQPNLSCLYWDHSIKWCLSHAIQIQRRNACLKHSRLFKVNKVMLCKLFFVVGRSLKGYEKGTLRDTLAQ